MLSAYNFLSNKFPEYFPDLRPKVDYPKRFSHNPLVNEQGEKAPYPQLQKKINELMKGIIPWEHLSSAQEDKLPQGFHRLKCEPCVFWHDKLSEYVLKTKGSYPIKFTGKMAFLHSDEDNIGRVNMAAGLRQIIQENKLDRLYVVRKYLFTLPIETWEINRDSWDEIETLKDPERSHVVVAEKMDLTTLQETEDLIKNMPIEEQKILLRQLFTLYFLSGYQDGHKWNFAFAKSGPQQGKLIVYDTEPIGLTNVHEKDSWKGFYFGNLRQLDISCGKFAMEECLDEKRGLPFSKEVKEEIYEEFKAKISMETAYIRAGQKHYKYCAATCVATLVAVSSVALFTFQQIFST